MDWVTQNWPLILVAGAFGWMMFRRGGQGGGCCGGGAREPDPRAPAEKTTEPRPAEHRH